MVILALQQEALNIKESFKRKTKSYALAILVFFWGGGLLFGIFGKKGIGEYSI